MADSVRFLHFDQQTVAYLGDVKFSFGRNRKGQWLRSESLSGQPLPEFTDAPASPPTHKFVDVAQAMA
jgi:hypothetical protein